MKDISIPVNNMFRLAAFLFALGLSPEATLAQGNGAPLLTTITNPSPVVNDNFGGAVAAMGSDGVLVGAEGAGEAYLFNLNGSLLTTFTNPEPQIGGGFGAAIATGGGDKVLIGSYNYVAGVPLSQVGRAYLFTTNGALLTTFTNPTPAIDGGFGAALAAVGSDQVLIGSPYAGASGAGTAYLYNTNGALLITFTNPVPASGDNFGTAVAAVGNDRVLISAIDYGGSKGTGGAAYLFSTNGTLLTTFTNPTPATYDYFGWSVAAVGSTRVIIGAYQDGTGAFQAGAAYLFSTNGTLLNTITNPTPAYQDWFAWSVAAVGSDHVVIGGVWDSTGATHAGSAYLYELAYPPLSIAQNGDTVSVSWVTAETGLILQQTGQLGTPTVWTDTTNPISTTGTTNVLQETMVTTNRLYHLRRP